MLQKSRLLSLRVSAVSHSVQGFACIASIAIWVWGVSSWLVPATGFPFLKLRNWFLVKWKDFVKAGVNVAG
jgi:hypothetical protein